MTDPFQLSKGRKADYAMVGTGAVGVQAAASHTNLANRWADREQAEHVRRLGAAQAEHTAVRTARKPDWHAHQGPGMSDAEARKAAKGVHQAGVDTAQAKVTGIRTSMGRIASRRAVRNRYLLGTGVVGGTLAFAGLHGTAKKTQPIAKYTKGEVDAATAGTVAGGGGYLSAGMFGVKPRAAEKEVHANPAYRKVWNDHRKVVGAQGREAYKSYPLSLPGAKRQRFLARHMGGRRGDVALGASIAAGAGAGALLVHHHNAKAAKDPNIKKGVTMVTSAFGVEHIAESREGAKRGATNSAFLDERVEKGWLGEALKGGQQALKGVQGGLTGSVGAAKTSSEGAGKLVGGKLLGAGKTLKPIGTAMTKTPTRIAVTGGVAAGGLAIGRKN